MFLRTELFRIRVRQDREFRVRRLPLRLEPAPQRPAQVPRLQVPVPPLLARRRLLITPTRNPPRALERRCRLVQTRLARTQRTLVARSPPARRRQQGARPLLRLLKHKLSQRSHVRWSCSRRSSRDLLTWEPRQIRKIVPIAEQLAAPSRRQRHSPRLLSIKMRSTWTARCSSSGNTSICCPREIVLCRIKKR